MLRLQAVKAKDRLKVGLQRRNQRGQEVDQPDPHGEEKGSL